MKVPVVLMSWLAALLPGCSGEPSFKYADSAPLTAFYSGPGKLGMRDVLALRCYPDEEKKVLYYVCAGRFSEIALPPGEREFRWSLRRHAADPAFGFFAERTEAGGYRVGVDASAKGLTVARQIATVEQAVTRTRAASEGRMLKMQASSAPATTEQER